MKQPARTDPHRPGAIIPVDYEHVLWYSLATSVGGWPQPSQGVNCVIDRRIEKRGPEGELLEVINGTHRPDGVCCVIGLRLSGALFADTGRDHGTGRCTVCGAFFVFGEIWRHIPTGEHIHLGHDCADKYNLVADRSEWEAWHAKQTRERAVAVIAREKAKARDAFIAEHEGLSAAFELRQGQGNVEDSKQAAILENIYSKLHAYGSLSEKQIAFVLKLADEIKNPPPVEAHVPAPEGRVTFDGEVVGSKVVDSFYGSTIKLTVKVATPAGSWLVWLTCPGSISGDKGDKLRLTATLTRSDRDQHFAFGKRPVAWTEEAIRLEAEKQAKKAARAAKKGTVNA